MHHLKILFLGEYSKPVIVGSSTYKVQINLFNSLTKKNIKCYFYEFEPSKSKFYKLFGKIKIVERINDNCVYTGGLVPFLLFIIFKINIVHFIVQRKFQIAFFPLLFCPWIKSVVTFHDTLNFSNNPYNRKFPKSINFIKYFLALFANRIFLYNKLDINFLPKIALRKIKIVKNGILDVSKQELVLKKSDYILYAGGESDIKGFEIIKQIIPKLNYKIVLAGVYNNFNSSNSNVEIIGLIEEKLIYKYIKNAKVLIIPSLYDSFSIIALEALTFGTPIIISNRCGISTYLTNFYDAIIFDPLDIASLVNNIKNIFNNGDLEKQIIQNGLITAKKFIWDEIANEYITNYKELWKINNL